MHGDTRLEWTQANRAKRSRTCRVAEPVEQLVRRIAADCDVSAARECAACLSGVVDEEFRRCCRIGASDGGTIVVAVDRPALVYPMRTQWLSLLQEALAVRSDGFSGRRIVFEHGNAGVRVPEVETNSARQ